MSRHSGLGIIRRRGVSARQNITATPSLTTVSHITIATGSSAVHNDIPGNTFHPVGASIASSISGFAAPIGGYDIDPLGPSVTPTAEPLWVTLRAAGPKIKVNKTMALVRNIDVAPTIMSILGVEPETTVDGRVLSKIFRN